MDIYTDWFPPWVNPLRIGVYQSPWPEGYTFSYWDGKYWHTWSASPQKAYENYIRYKDIVFPKPWRGLSSEWKWIG